MYMRVFVQVRAGHHVLPAHILIGKIEKSLNADSQKQRIGDGRRSIGANIWAKGTGLLFSEVGDVGRETCDMVNKHPCITGWKILFIDHD